MRAARAVQSGMDPNHLLVGRIAGPLAHDLHCYLAMVDACVTVLQRRLVDASAQEVLLHARGATDGALRLTGALIDQTRGDVLPAMEIDLAALVRRDLELAARLVPPAVTVTASLDQPAIVCGGRVALDRVVLTLLLDACDALPDGGEVEVAVRVATPGEPVVLEVSHTGVRSGGLDLGPVRETADHLRADFHVGPSRAGGTRAVVTFPPAV